ncbi:unnamed protein product [Spirodela intermedia]|uniref:Uncharacterized protein n=1 Tax=Spirodela intermedia TaxID=51605 RepID=A0A7I8IPU2_SPIIN|nr:unnamed protein product [Spirodela intermedia]CAA6659821.1 unnamed protein product [Spirodela intermedia]
MSKKVKARKVIVEEEEERVAAVAESMAALGSGKPRDFFDEDHACTNTPRQRAVQVYHRRAKRPRHCRNRPSFFESVSWKIDPGSRISGNGDEDGDDDLRPGKKQKGQMKHELLGLLTSEDADPCSLVGLACKVFWPMDNLWYRGSITGFCPESGLHKILYKDGDIENLNIGKERIKFNISRSEMQQLNLKHSSEKDMMVNDEMLAMAAVLNDCQDLEPGDLVWAKLTGHAMWPAVVIDEAYVGANRVLKTMQGERAVSVQFFGTHDFARFKIFRNLFNKTCHSVSYGAASGYHLKCKKKLRGGKNVWTSALTWFLADEENQRMIRHLFPLEIGDLCVLSLGSIVRDSQYFHNKRCIWPEGYTASRKFFSIRDPNLSHLYKMEVLRNPKAKSRPLFRVTPDDGGQVEGSNPNACWREIFSRIKKKCLNFQKTGSQMFGFSNRKVSHLIQALFFPLFRLASGGSRMKYSKLPDLPGGYRPVTIGQRDLDRCDVCHMDEEYEDNLFLQCDKCRMMVHARCYGELEPKDGSLWHCNLCRPQAPKVPPRCCLCPVTGGAMKPTTDGRWAHLTCAIWIPETCLLDVKKMEPIDGLSRINKMEALCSICGVPYGACIQDDDQCIPLLSFCRKHRQPSNECSPLPEECHTLSAQLACSAYVPTVPPHNPSGCARSERPQVLAAASVKRSFVENRPYLVSGCCKMVKAAFTFTSNSTYTSIAEKYVYMRATFRKRLAFVRIHGFGVFAKLDTKLGTWFAAFNCKAPIADQREHLIYNSLVGAGTYMFRIDDERVIDATKAGSIAQLINHSCEVYISSPNCYSRVISVDGDEHIIIFAKRDIKQFFSIDEQLACYCGFPRCRGVVNDVDSEERVAKIWVPRSELIPWSGE